MRSAEAEEVATRESSCSQSSPAHRGASTGQGVPQKRTSEEQVWRCCDIATTAKSRGAQTKGRLRQRRAGAQGA